LPSYSTLNELLDNPVAVCDCCFSSGEDVYISLYGVSTDVNVRLARNSVIVETTYISMANQSSVSIVNRSDTIVHYQWKRCATEQEEEQQKLRWDVRSCSSP
jgi:hydrocephalus-inducing protein